MRAGELMPEWYASRYTGLFAGINRVPPRPQDPDACVWAGTVPASEGRPQELATGGSGWDSAHAEAACAGEAIERFQAYQLPADGIIESSIDDWPLDEAYLNPDQCVLFHSEQYAIPGFPFERFTPSTRCRWVCCRRAVDGEPCWAPAELVYLFGSGHRLCPSLSTGLACGRGGDPVLLRGLREVIERDALMGAWWGRYPLEEWSEEEVLTADIARRVRRPNLRYRFYRVESPFSSHVAICTVEGEDREGYCFSAGSACRETRGQAWDKALLEAIHGRYYVRHLLSEPADDGPPRDFAGHAVYYSRHPERLRETMLLRAASRGRKSPADTTETLNVLTERLGAEHPVLFRLMTPPGIVAEDLDWVVLRVVVPGVQPMHGDHLFPFLGGPLWGRGIEEWSRIPPHPFP
jgi:ribosomal protein S12 methylthiotransferase accessory factor